MAELDQKKLHELLDTMHNLVGDDQQTNNMMDSIIQLMAVPDDQFAILSEGIIQSFQQSLNNPNDKIALAQAFNATGTRLEDVLSTFDQLQEEIDGLALPLMKRDFLKDIIFSIYNAINDTEGIAKRNVPVAIELCHENAKIPQYAHITDSGADVYAIEDITIHPGETKLISTGIKLAPPPGFEIQVRAKSGRALRTKMRLGNGIGTIDQGYRDELGIIIENIDPPIKNLTLDTEGHVTSIEYGSDFFISAGEKICQIVLSEVPKMAFYRVDKVAEIGEDRKGGFGSSGLL